MNPTELRLFSKPEQTLLVQTQKKRLDEMSEDEIDELLTRVRRARNKYMKLYRRQSASNVEEHETRAGTDTSNQRTYRKAEIFEDALSRVARALATAAKATARELKDERIAAAAAAKGSSRKQGKGSTSKGRDTGSKRRKPAKGRSADNSRKASSKASGARNQAKRDKR